MLKMAVIGKDVSESLSPKMHTFIMNKLGVEIKYDKVSIPVENFENEFPKVLKDCETCSYRIFCKKLVE